MFDKLCRFVQFSVLVAPFAVAVAEIRLDYYFGNSLRTGLMKCSNEVVKQHCILKCGQDHACFLGQCFCVQRVQEDPSDEEREDVEESSEEVTFIDFEDYTERTPRLRPQVPKASNGQHTLRHHIAHFCPNLDIARQCIRKCIKLGKPAFCGKDHVCYCGHKYDYPIDDKNIDPADAYAEFKDMYEKYFGPRGKTIASSQSFEDDN